MRVVAENPFFLEAFGLLPGGVVSIVGAGGKTSLLFHLGREAKKQGMKTLLATTTKMSSPASPLYDAIDLTGDGFLKKPPATPGIYVAGKTFAHEKMAGLDEEVLARHCGLFDMVLLEADGAARKPLKGWLDFEPVVPAFTTDTIGVVDIQTVGRTINETLVHRLDCFETITGARPGETVTLNHLEKIINHPKGIFAKAVGNSIVYINKVESEQDLFHARSLGALLADSLSLDRKVFAGSVQRPWVEQVVKVG
jgi:probable selenium-dependent hydroxylase accessory protein YqeC